MLEKKNLRKELLESRDKLKQEDVFTMSDKILKTIKQFPEWEQAEVIYTYVSFGKEVDTISLIKECFKEGKKVAVPKVLGKGKMEFFYISSIEELKRSSWGILEPEGIEEKLAIPFSFENISFIKEQEKQLFIIIPGVGFDKKLNRLGYGGGFYDRYLKQYGVHNFLKISLAFPIQIKENILFEKHDICMDRIVTPEGIFCSQ